MRLERLFGITHEDRIRLALTLENNEVIESSFCDQQQPAHYCQIDKEQLPWTVIAQAKYLVCCKNLNKFIMQRLHINCGCFVVYKFLNTTHLKMVNRIMDPKRRKLLQFSLSLKEIINEFPKLERYFVDSQNVERFRASQTLVASLASRKRTSATNNGIGKKKIKISRVPHSGSGPQLYFNPLLGGEVRPNDELYLSMPLDITKFVLNEQIGRCAHGKREVVRLNNRSHDEGESLYEICNYCNKTLNKLS